MRDVIAGTTQGYASANAKANAKAVSIAHAGRKSRIGGDGTAEASSDARSAAAGAETVGCGRHEPLYYSVRPKAKDVGAVEGIGVELPAAESAIVRKPTAEASVAAIDSVEAGRVTGWACHRLASRPSTPLARPSAHMYAVVDGTVVASVDVTTVLRDVDVATAVADTCRGGESVNDNGNGNGNDVIDSAEAGKPVVFAFDIELPPLPHGIHELRVFVDDASGPSGPSAPNGKSAPEIQSAIKSTLVEAFHSPLKFEESSIEPSMAAVIKRKDEIITHRNNLLIKIWNEVETQLPWKRYERDAADIPLGDAGGSGGSGGSGRDRPDTLAVILVRSDPSNGLRRDLIRKSWGATSKMSDNNLMLRFFVDGQFTGPHKEVLEGELKEHGDIVQINLTPDKSDEVDRILFSLHHAVKHHDASFYFFVADQMIVMPGILRKYLTRKLNSGNHYMGCMKSGEIVDEEGKMWYEPLHDRFGRGESKRYPLHARAAMFGFSRFVARHVARSKEVLQKYSNSDVTVGTWMLGLDVEYDDNPDFCRVAAACLASGSKPMGIKEPSCDGICAAYAYEDYWKTCGSQDA